MPADLASYLATHYLTADTKPSKKRKRKHESSSGLLITDDDDSGWTKPRNNADTDEERDGPATVAGTSAEFRKAKKSSWKTVGAPASNPDNNNEEQAAAADAILTAAAAENAAAGAADDEAPVALEVDNNGIVKMADGSHAGLQSGAAVSAQLKKRRREERAAYERERAERSAKGLAEQEEVVYRDATGRRIDVSLKREEARRAILEAEEKERVRKEALKGEVQVEEARRRKELLEDAAVMPIARRADDEEMNQELKAQGRWNDPMAQFVKRGDGGGGATSAKPGKRNKGRPFYTGPALPNRYGIRPGYRWDGVDRGNGFEAERFKAINRRERNKGLEYSWQMDE